MVNHKLIRLGLITVLCVWAAETVPPDSGLTVHEWGTFTTVADQTGNSQQWTPLASPSDLPCFVHRFDGRNFKFITSGTARMETPVLYFYAAHPVVANIRVNFPQGMITEWYPQATQKPVPESAGAIAWNQVSLSASRDTLPQESGPSHYYKARETGSLTAEIGGERDRMIFYRGVGNVAVPLHTFLKAGQLQLDNPSLTAFVFQNRGQNDGDAEVIRQKLYTALVASGLYPKEAHAMLETWRDSWFEEGLRVFYILPRETVDAVLPIAISPRPDKLVRTFVGRIELLAPWMRDQIETALRTGDVETLSRRGRFLEPFLAQMHAAPANTRVNTWLSAKRTEAAQRFLSTDCK